MARSSPAPRTPVIERVAQGLHLRRELLAVGLDPGQQPVAGDDVQHGQRRGTADGVAAECAAVLAGPEQARGVAYRDHRPQRQPAGQALGESDHVGHDARALEGEPATGAPHAGLHLIEDEQGAVMPRHRARRREIAVRGGDDPALALDRLEEDRGRTVGDSGLQGARVAVRNEGDVPGERLERRPLGGLSGQGERAHGAAVEAGLGGDDMGAPGLAAELERRLVGLGPGVAEEDPPVQAGDLQEAFGQPDRGLVEEQVGGVRDPGDLIGDGGDDVGMGVAER